jgi:hypothetical protein
VTEVVGDVRPAALGVALSPVPVVTLVLLLSSDRSLGRGSAFAFGWVMSALTVSLLVGTLGLLRTATVGAALGGLNPKDPARTAAASATIGQADLDPDD